MLTRGTLQGLPLNKFSLVGQLQTLEVRLTPRSLWLNLLDPVPIEGARAGEEVPHELDPDRGLSARAAGPAL